MFYGWGNFRKSYLDNMVYNNKTIILITLVFLALFANSVCVQAQTEVELLTNPDFAGNLNGWTRSSVIDSYVSYDGNFGEAKIFSNAGVSKTGTTVLEQDFTIPSVATGVRLRVRHWCDCDGSAYLKVMIDDTEVGRITSSIRDYREMTDADIMATYSLAAGSTHTIKLVGVVGNYGTKSCWVSHCNLYANMPPARTVSGTVTDQFTRPLSGVTITLSGDDSGTTSTDASGNWSRSVYEGQTITFTPSHSGVSSFSPTSRSATIGGSDITGYDFTATLSTYTVSGTITDDTASPLSGHTVNMTGDRSGSTSTDASGNYSFLAYYGDSVTVTPANMAYDYSPVSRNVSVTGNKTGQNFTGTLKGHIVSGTVSWGANPISGATITFSHDGGTATTNASGQYSRLVDYGTTTTLTVSHPGYSNWTPPSISLTNVVSDTSGQDFSGTINTYTITGNVNDGVNPVDGATLTFSHDGGTTTSDASGNYSYTVNYGTTTTITPSHIAYQSWTPPSITLSNIGENKTGNNFAGTIKTFAVTGNVNDGASPIQGVTISFSHDSGTTTTDASGNYSYSVPYGTTSTITPSHEGYNGWSPATREVTNVADTVSGQNFAGTINTYTITGTVTDGSNPVQGVTLTFSHDGGTTTTDASGNYTYTVDYNTSTTVTPSHQGYENWNPANIALTAIKANQTAKNFQGTIISFAVSGNVTDGSDPIQGVTLTFSHDSGTATTDASGNFSYSVPYGTTTTITPSHEGYHGWSPANREVTNVAGAVTGQNFAGTINTYTISGNLTDGANPIQGVTLTFSHDSGTTTTDASGNYSYTVDYNTDTTITPSHQGYENWSPANIQLTSVKENQTSKNFQGDIKHYNISGNVTDGSSPLQGVTLTFSHDSGTTTTDASGNYSYSVDYGTTTTISPSHEGYHGWSPATREVANVTADVSGRDFAGVINTYEISGTAKDTKGAVIAGTTLRFSHDGGTTTTDAAGNYSYAVNYKTTTTITPERVGYSVWTPSSRDLTEVKSNTSAQDFTGTVDLHTVSGRILDDTGAALDGVTVSFIATSAPVSGENRSKRTFASDSTSTVTDASGNYSMILEYGSSGTLRPAKTNYDFAPAERALASLEGDLPGQDFTGEYAVGNLKVYLEPDAVLASSPMWRRSGTTVWFRSGQMESEIPIGEYTLEFTDVDGWITPDAQKVTINKKAQTTISATYVEEIKYGSLQVFIEPEDNAALAPARWSVKDSGIWRQSGDTIAEIATGEVTVVFKNVEGWDTPANQTLEIEENILATTTGTYRPLNTFKPEIHYFTVEPEVAGQGDPVVLSWDVRDADEISIDNGIGDVVAKGTREIILDETTTFTLTASNSFGENKASITAEKVEEAAINWFTSSNPPGSPASLGNEATLSWSITGADRAGIDVDGDGEVDLEINPEGGELQVMPGEEGTEYTLYAFNILGEKTAKTFVAVTSLPEILEFSVDHSELLAGTRVTFSWLVNGAESLSLSPEPGQVQGNSVSFKPEAGGEYILKAENQSGAVDSRLNIKILEETKAADLSVTLQEFASPPARKHVAGQEVKVKLLVSNTGEEEANKFYIRLFSNDSKLSYASKRIKSLKPGEEKAVELSFVPATSGKHTIKVKVDDDGVIPEEDEQNNQAEKLISVGKADGVDLMVTDVDVRKAGRGAPDGAIKISFAIVNGGRVTSDSFQYRVFLASSNTVSVSASKSVLLSEDHIEKLKSNGKVSINLNALLPDEFSKRFYVIILADVHNAVDEEETGNNTFSAKYRTKKLK